MCLILMIGQNNSSHWTLSPELLITFRPHYRSYRSQSSNRSWLLSWKTDFCTKLGTSVAYAQRAIYELCLKNCSAVFCEYLTKYKHTEDFHQKCNRSMFSANGERGQWCIQNWKEKETFYGVYGLKIQFSSLVTYSKPKYTRLSLSFL
jgi:hypothetical protein